MWLASEFKGYTIGATDGEIGVIVDLLFDDKRWLVRWFVVDTGVWLPGRQVLLPPAVLAKPSRSISRIPVPLTRQQVKDSPALDADAPVSRQMEADIYRHYGWSPYWTWDSPLGSPFAVPPGSPAPIPSAPPVPVPPVGAAEAPEPRPVKRGDPHLRSAGYVTNSTIQATDGEIGHLEDFLIDDEAWTIRYLIIDTVNWWPGKKVLMAPGWVSEIDWAERRMGVNLPRQKIKDGPKYSPSATPDRNYEAALHAHYERPPYWEER